MSYATLEDLAREELTPGDRLIVELEDLMDGDEPDLAATIAHDDGSESYFYLREGKWKPGGWSAAP